MSRRVRFAREGAEAGGRGGGGADGGRGQTARPARPGPRPAARALPAPRMVADVHAASPVGETHPAAQMLPLAQMLPVARTLPGARPATRPGSRPDGAELEARDAALRVLRGEEWVAAGLGRAPAATRRVAASRGEPLAPGLREWLEQGFGAELGAVRIHRDAASAGAARGARARAFAAGRDIYFGAGAYRPETEAGRELIAHEVAHVLQQTGRRGADGRLRVTGATGTGPVQREWESPVDSTSSPPTLEQVFDRHRAAWTDAVDRVQIAALQIAYLAAQDADTFWQARETFTEGTAADPVYGIAHAELQPGGLACLYDALKLAGRYDGAARLLHAHPDVRSLFFSAEAYERYVDLYGVEEALERIYAVWDSAAFFGAATRRNILDRTVIFLLGPTRAISRQVIREAEVRRTGGRVERVPAVILVDEVAAELRRRERTTSPIENELHFVAVKVVGEVEGNRFNALDAIWTAVRQGEGADRNDAYRKRAAAFRLRSWADQVLAQRDALLGATRAQLGTSREYAQILVRDLAPAMRNIAETAIEFWRLGGVVGAELGSDAVIEGLGVSAREVIDGIRTEPEFAELPAAILELARTILERRDDGTLPAPDDYDEQRREARAEFRLHVYRHYERPAADIFRAATGRGAGRDRIFFPADADADAAATVDRVRLARLSWVLLLASEILETVDEYDVRADRAFVDRVAVIDPAYPATDFRDAHRIILSRLLLGSAGHLGWTAIVELAEPVAQATEPAQREDVVALLETWRHDTAAPIGRLRDDSGNERVIGWEPLRAREIVDFYLIQDYTNLISELGERLTAEEGQYEAAGEPILNRAFEAAMAQERPQRYVIGAWVVALRPPPARGARPGATPPPPRESIQTLLRQHPNTRALIEGEESRRGHPVAVIVPARQEREAVIWLLPQPVGLVIRLQRIRALNEFIAGHVPALAELPEQPTPDQVGALEWEAWWALFRAVLAGGGRREAVRRRNEARRLLRESGLIGTLRSERDLAFQLLQNQIRDATSHERKRIVLHRLTLMLRRYDRRGAIDATFNIGQRDGGVRRVPIRRLAEETLDELNRFINQIPAREDRAAHFTVALLELSGLIEEKLAGNEDHQVLFRWIPALTFALDRIDDTQNPLGPYLLPEEAADASFVQAGKERLERVLEGMERVVLRRQREWGITAAAGDGTLENSGYVQALGQTRRFGRDTPIRIDGVTWQIIQIVRPFRYHPSSWGRRGQSGRTRVGDPLLVLADGVERTPAQRGDDTLLWVLRGDDLDPIEVKEGDDHILEPLAWATVQYTQAQDLAATAEAIQMIVEFGLDLAELFPGVGPAVAAARLAGTIIIFLGSNELGQLVEAVVNDPERLLGDLIGRFRDTASPEGLLDYFLFGRPIFDQFSQRRGSRRSRGGFGSSRSRRVRRLVRKMERVAAGIAGSLGKAQGVVRDRRQAAQIDVMRRPVLVGAIRLIEAHYDLLAGIPDRIAELGDLTEEAAALAGRINGVIEAIGTIELPRNLVPMEELVGVVIDLIGHRLGGKYRLGIHVLLELLEFAGLRQEVEGAIADAIRGLGVDTDNLLPIWQDRVIPLIEETLRDAQAALRNRLSQVFGAVPGFDPVLAAPSVRVEQTADNDFPEAQPFAAGRPRQPRRVPDLTSGAPLPPKLRTDAERRFGHDFGHVRLHAGGEAGRFTREARSHAITTGSHVLLGSGVRPGTRGGDRVLRHELAHVIQQTGPRPLGGRHDSKPRAGAPGRGLVVHPRAEAAADRAAAQTERGFAGRPLDVSATGAGGMQPSLIDEIGRRFLGYLIDYGEIEEEVERIDRTRATTGRRLIARDVRAAVRQVARKLDEVFRHHQRRLRVHPPVQRTFGPVKPIIADHLHNQRVQIANAIEDLAIEASVVRGRSTDSSPPRMALHVHRFQDKLIRYIFGRTGILLEIELNKRGVGAAATMVANDPIGSVSVRYVHLLPVAGNSRLWQLALDNTFHTTAPAARAPFRAAARAYLAERGPASGVWSSSGFEFNLRTKTAVEALMVPAAGGGRDAIDPADLPRAVDYAHPDGAITSTALNHIGLRLGAYRDGNQRGRQRESHHIIQFLMLDYFQNEADRKAFPLLPANRGIYPGLHDPGGVPNELRHGSETVDVFGFDHAQRGGRMPAILLSRLTHRTGRLHVTASAADDFGEQTGEDRPAGVVDSIFRGYLSDRYKAAEARAADFRDYRAERGDGEVRAEIYSAMQRTYRWMRKRMLPRLKDSLETIECRVYNDIAAARTGGAGNGFELTRAAATRVYSEAERRSDREFDGRGWKRN